MAKMIFLTVGSLKNKACLALQEEYLGRIRHYTSCELIEARDATQKIPESENLLKKIGSSKSKITLLFKNIFKNKTNKRKSIW